METVNSNAKNLEDKIKDILSLIGEDIEREGLIDTPSRIARMFKEIFRGYDKNQFPKITTFENENRYTGMIVDSGDYYSMCEHHMMPFFGKYLFAYIPKENGKIIGISKVARIINYLGAKLQLQERFAKEVVTELSKAIGDEHNGMAIYMKGTHLCKSMRGVKNKGEMVTLYSYKMEKENLNHFTSLISTI